MFILSKDISRFPDIEMKTYTTGDIAQICDVTQRTVIRWIERGDLIGFKLPGRGNNRVTEEDLLKFLQKHNIPLANPTKSDARDLILIVDDEPAVAKAIQRVLRSAGYPTEIALDGFEAGSELIRRKPVLMTLDLNMPGINGMEVIKQVRSNMDTVGTKILVISSAEISLLQQSVEFGADAYLQKPFTNSDLLNAVDQLVTDSSRVRGKKR